MNAAPAPFLDGGGGGGCAHDAHAIRESTIGVRQAQRETTRADARNEAMRGALRTPRAGYGRRPGLRTHRRWRILPVRLDGV